MTTEIHAVILARVHMVQSPGAEAWQIIPYLEVLPRRRPGDFPQHSVHMFHYRLFENGCMLTVGNSEKSAKLSQCYEISSADLWGLPTVECLGQGSVPNWLLKRRPPMSIHSPPTKPSQLQHFHPLIGPLSSTFLALSSEGQMMRRLGMQPTIDRKSLMSRLSRSKTSSLAWCYPLAQVCSVLFNSQWWAELAFEPWLMFSRSGYITTERQHCLGCGWDWTDQCSKPPRCVQETCRLKEAFEAIDQLGDISCKLGNKMR